MKFIIWICLIVSASANALSDNDSLLNLGAGATFTALNDFEVPANASSLWLCRDSIKVAECSIRERSIVDWISQCNLELVPSKETRKLVKGTALPVLQTVKYRNSAKVEFDHAVIKAMYCWETESSRYSSVSYPLKFGKVKILTENIFQISEQEPKEIEAQNICK